MHLRFDVEIDRVADSADGQRGRAAGQLDNLLGIERLGPNRHVVDLAGEVHLGPAGVDVSADRHLIEIGHTGEERLVLRCDLLPVDEARGDVGVDHDGDVVPLVVVDVFGRDELRPGGNFAADVVLHRPSLDEQPGLARTVSLIRGADHHMCPGAGRPDPGRDRAAIERGEIADVGRKVDEVVDAVEREGTARAQCGRRVGAERGTG